MLLYKTLTTSWLNLIPLTKTNSKKCGCCFFFLFWRGEDWIKQKEEQNIWLNYGLIMKKLKLPYGLSILTYPQRSKVVMVQFYLLPWWLRRHLKFTFCKELINQFHIKQEKAVRSTSDKSFNLFYFNLWTLRVIIYALN